MSVSMILTIVGVGISIASTIVGAKEQQQAIEKAAEEAVKKVNKKN